MLVIALLYVAQFYVESDFFPPPKNQYKKNKGTEMAFFLGKTQK